MSRIIRQEHSRWSAACGLVSLGVIILFGCINPSEDNQDDKPLIPVVEGGVRGESELADACASTQECAAPMICDLAYERGYCRPPTCGEACDELGGTCASVAGQPAQCWVSCDGQSERAGFECVSTAQGDVLLPEEMPTEVVEFDSLERALDVVCESSPGPNVPGRGDTREFSFDVEPGVTSFMVVNTIAGPETFYPAALVMPDDEEVDLVLDYRHHNARLGDMQGDRLMREGSYGAVSVDWSILFPYAADREAIVQAGTYTMRVISDAEDLCFYVLKERESGKTLDINFYFTDLDNFNAAHASGDEDFQEILARVDDIYEQADIELGNVRYFNVPESARAYQVIRDSSDIKRLTALGRATEPGLGSALSVDVFLVDSLALQNGTLLGVSGGIPGAPGMHGNPQNGLIFGLQDLGRFNERVAHVMAHEIGHFLGLRHTTELAVGTDLEEDFDLLVGATDPLSDTPECPNIRTSPNDCADITNLMFPAVPQTGSTDLPDISAEQKGVFLASPLTK